MAHLPPRAPNMAQTWPQTMPIHSLAPGRDSISGVGAQPPSWVDEFIDFSAARRGAHRRSVSDSVAFLQLLEDCPPSSPPGGFERLDDEQLMSMFADDVAASPLSNLSTPSDQNSNDEEKPTVLPPPQRPKEEPAEAEDPCKPGPPPATKLSNASSDAIVDPKRIKRILANRQSAQRSRVRKLQYISELERSVTALQTEVSALSPRVAFLDHQRLILNVDNSALKQRIAALVQDKIFKDAHQEALRKEIERLRQIHREQSLRKMAATAPPPAPSPPGADNNNNGFTDEDNPVSSNRDG
ncbi:hypothetical protein NMG60_11037018 [Bertholletia excelsa]